MRKRLADPPPPHEAHARLARIWPTTFLLESRDGPARIARYSVLGFDPVGSVMLGPRGLVATGALPAPARDQAPLDYLRRIHAFYATDDRTTPFVGGLVGSVGYDFARTMEPAIEREAAQDWPRFLFGLYLDGIVYDHEAGTATYVSRGEDRSQRLGPLLTEPAPQPAPGYPSEHAPGPPPARTAEPADELHVGRVSTTTDHDTFIARVQEAQRLIRAGEAFQIVLSRAFGGTYEGSLLHLYSWLRQQAPVPYLYHLRFEGRELLGASPEGLVRVRGGRAETFPIAGTRPITGDPEADRAAGEDLRDDAKETAEHAMLVDLARNDLSRVCVPGTVEVGAYQELHAFRDVQHLVSHVSGELAPGQDAWSALAAVFPAGTVSGAPKLRAMEHIDALEDVPRGPYAGAACYASFNGDFDSAITIRSLSAQHGRLTVQAGAGIVHRSQPESEWQETAHKARTLLTGLQRFGARIDEATATTQGHVTVDGNAAGTVRRDGSAVSAASGTAADPAAASARAASSDPAVVSASAAASAPAASSDPAAASAAPHAPGALAGASHAPAALSVAPRAADASAGAPQAPAAASAASHAPAVASAGSAASHAPAAPSAAPHAPDAPEGAPRTASAIPAASTAPSAPGVPSSAAHPRGDKGLGQDRGGATGPAAASRKRPRIVLIDNYDSFTHNLAHGLAVAGADVHVVRNDAIDRAGVVALQPAGIVLSPGPGSPAVPRDIGVCGELIVDALPVPMLGVCLGMQAMAHLLGGAVGRAPEVVHGESRTIRIESHALFAGLPSSLPAGRYHSLCVERAPPLWLELARGDGILMAMAHPAAPLVGVQFHPESILTPHGDRMLANFVEMCR